jgi:hypothetical protein
MSERDGNEQRVGSASPLPEDSYQILILVWWINVSRSTTPYVGGPTGAGTPAGPEIPLSGQSSPFPATSRARATGAKRVSNMTDEQKGGSLLKWSINRCLVVTTAHKARSMRGEPIELSDGRSQRNYDSFTGMGGRKSGWEQVIGRAD